MRKHILFFLACTLLTGYFVKAQNYLVDETNDTIDVNTTWAYDTVFVDTTLTILDDVTLSVEPGTKIIFRGFHEIQVEGTLLSQGTASDSIIYTVDDTTGYHNYTHTGWGGIKIDNETGSMDNNDTTRFAYCSFYYGYNKDNDWNEGTGGAVKLRYNAYAEFTNCDFANNTTLQWGGAFGLVYDATALIDSCNFYYNNAVYNGNYNGGGAIAIGHQIDGTYFDQTIISNCYFYQNSSQHDQTVSEERYGGGAIKISGYSDALVKNCVFAENYSTTQGGAIIISGYCQPYIINNLFVGNSAEHNGGAVALKYYAGGYHINNTVLSNYSGNNGGAYSIGCDNDSCFFANNIIGENSGVGGYSQFYIDSPNEFKQFYNNDINGGLGSYTSTVTHANNIDEDPMFVDPMNSDFRLSCGSPCIDYGIDIDTLLSHINLDIAGVPRLVNGAYDLGAYETQLPVPVDLGEDIEICDGETIILDAGEGYASYLWGTGDITQTIEVGNEGTYPVTVINEYECEDSDTIDVTVNPSPVADAGADDVVTCTLEYVLSANEPGAGETGLWQITAGNGSFDNPNLHNATFTADAPSSCTLTWTLDNGNCQDTDDITITFEEDLTDPSITCVGNQEVDADETHTYTAQGTEFDPVDYDDNCEIASVLNDFNGLETLAGEAFPEGTTTVIWTATDMAGNIQTCTYDVVVNTYVNLSILTEKGISIYPNPVSGMLHFDFTDFDVQRISISDMSGKVIMERAVINHQEIIDVSNYPDGVYLITVETGKQSITTKIIKE
ncbi:MAG: T9SS type A sorting domain-containing protein [Bacteroidales bacterium]